MVEHKLILDALSIYKQAMCRDKDRPQRVKFLNEVIDIYPNAVEALLYGFGYCLL